MCKCCFLHFSCGCLAGESRCFWSQVPSWQRSTVQKNIDQTLTSKGTQGDATGISMVTWTWWCWWWHRWNIETLSSQILYSRRYTSASDGFAESAQDYPPTTRPRTHSRLHKTLHAWNSKHSLVPRCWELARMLLPRQQSIQWCTVNKEIEK